MGKDETVQPRLTVSRLKGKPFYGQAVGQLRLTCTFSAECAQRAEMHPYSRFAGLPPVGEVCSMLTRLPNGSPMPPERREHNLSTQPAAKPRPPLLRPRGVEPSEPSEPGPLCGLLFSPTSLDENMV